MNLAGVDDANGMPIARMTWLEHPRLYIDFLWSDDAASVVKMFAEFRRRYPDRFVYFHARIDSEPMMRFVRMTGAVETPHGYRVHTGVRRRKMNPNIARKFNALSKNGQAAYNRDCAAESKDHLCPITQNKLMTDGYKNVK